MNQTAAPTWRSGSQATFADIGGARYCVSQIDILDPFKGYMVERNGVAITGPDLVGQPAGHRTVEAAQRYAEQYAAQG